MSFNSYKPFKRKNLFPKFTIVFLLGMFFVLFFTNAFTIVTGIENASQYIKQIILTNDGSTKGATGVIIDGNISGGRIGSDLYCTLDFSKCVNIKGIISTGDLGSLGIIKTGDLATFKLTEIDPLISNLSGKITTISGSLSTYAKTSDLDAYAPLTELSKYVQSTTLSGYATTGELKFLADEILRLDRNIDAIAAASCEVGGVCSGTGTLERN
ncbi:MAG: hypothetical protein WAZ12_00390 [Candidatus Absconditicoccaceae bacterium]